MRFPSLGKGPTVHLRNPLVLHILHIIPPHRGWHPCGWLEAVCFGLGGVLREPALQPETSEKKMGVCFLLLGSNLCLTKVNIRRNALLSNPYKVTQNSFFFGGKKGSNEHNSASLLCCSIHTRVIYVRERGNKKLLSFWFCRWILTSPRVQKWFLS